MYFETSTGQPVGYADLKVTGMYYLALATTPVTDPTVHSVKACELKLLERIFICIRKWLKLVP